MSIVSAKIASSPPKNLAASSTLNSPRKKKTRPDTIGRMYESLRKASFLRNQQDTELPWSAGGQFYVTTL